VHNEEPHGLLHSPSIIKVIKSRSMRWACHVARMEDKHAYSILVLKRQLRRPVHSWEFNIKVDLMRVW